MVLHNGNGFKVFLSRFGTFLKSELKFSKLPVQSSHDCVTCAHQKKAGFHFFEQVANDSVQLFSVSYIINCLCHVDLNVLSWVSTPQHLDIRSQHKSLHAKWLNTLS